MNKINYYLEMAKTVSPLIVPKGLNYLKYKITKPRPVVPVSKYTPQIASLMLINDCNLRCSYCGLVKMAFLRMAAIKKKLQWILSKKLLRIRY